MERIFLLVTLFFIVVACSPAQQASSAQAVESFLQALVSKDEARLIASVCSGYELDALLEYDAFALVETSLEGLSCQQTGIGNGNALVTCQGSIEASYGNEQRNFDLSERTYTVIDDGGEWLVCGYTK